MKLIVDNLAINYIDEGEGKIILLLHGWGSDLGVFDVLATELKDSYRVIRLDLPGFGGSELPDDDWSLDNYIELINSFCKKRDVSDLHAVIGHSLGGRIAIKGFGSKKLKADKLILLASHGIRESRSIKSLVYLAIAKIGKFATMLLPTNQRSKLRRRLYKSAGSSDYLSAGPMRQTFTNIVKEDLQEVASNIKAPTLLIYGSDDATTPPKYGKLFSSLITGSTLEIVQGAGHYVHVDKSQKVTDLVRKFLT